MRKIFYDAWLTWVPLVTSQRFCISLLLFLLSFTSSFFLSSHTFVGWIITSVLALWIFTQYHQYNKAFSIMRTNPYSTTLHPELKTIVDSLQLDSHKMLQAHQVVQNYQTKNFPTGKRDVMHRVEQVLPWGTRKIVWGQTVLMFFLGICTFVGVVLVFGMFVLSGASIFALVVWGLIIVGVLVSLLFFYGAYLATVAQIPKDQGPIELFVLQLIASLLSVTQPGGRAHKLLSKTLVWWINKQMSSSRKGQEQRIKIAKDDSHQQSYQDHEEH
jgi:hypothetical protein